MRDQQQRQVGPKVYSLHAPELECIGKGRPHRPYEFDCKVAVATTNARAPGGQFVTYIGALHGNPYDGHTLKDTLASVAAITGLEPERTFVDKGYRGHDYVRSGVGQNVRLLLRWFALLLCFFLGWLYEAVLFRRLSPA